MGRPQDMRILVVPEQLHVTEVALALSDTSSEAQSSLESGGLLVPFSIRFW